MRKKNTKAAESEEGRGFICEYVCAAICRRSCASNEEKKEKVEWLIGESGAVPCFCLYMWPDVGFVYFCRKTPKPKIEKNQFHASRKKKSVQEVCTSAESAATFCSSLFSRSLMELSSGTRAGTKQQPPAPQLHPFDCVLLHVWSHCLFTMHKPDLKHPSAYQNCGLVNLFGCKTWELSLYIISWE